MNDKIKQSLTRKFSASGDYPSKPPNRNYIPFDNPKRKCSAMLCPNFSLDCGLCKLHCRKIHRGTHTGLTNKKLQELLDKYSKVKGK